MQEASTLDIEVRELRAEMAATEKRYLATMRKVVDGLLSATSLEEVHRLAHMLNEELPPSKSSSPKGSRLY